MDENNRTDMLQAVRNDWMLNKAYREGERLELDELEILKRFSLALLNIKNEAIQKEIDRVHQSTASVLFNPIS